MGATITPPDDSILLITWTYTGPPPRSVPWQSCRRIIALDTYVSLEGLNFDGRDKTGEKDVNRLIPWSEITGFSWKYEPKPAPPPQPKGRGQPGARPGPRGR